ncbi:hypothetical protein ES703_56808 [subsurface metagenome]
MRELHCARAARAETEESRIKEQRQLELIKAIRSKTERYAEMIMTEMEQLADELCQRLRSKTEQQAK